MSKVAKSGGVGLSGVLLIVFVVLKLTNLINWSWLWVLSPLWISGILIILILLVAIIIGAFWEDN